MRRLPGLALFSFLFVSVFGLAAPPRYAQQSDSIRLTLESTVSDARNWGPLGGFAISPDGRQLAYIATEGGGRVAPSDLPVPQYIWLKPIDGGNARRLSMTELEAGIFDLAFSPDSRSLVFWVPNELRRVSIAGGSSTVICEGFRSIHGLSWGLDGGIVFSAGNRVMRVAASGGSPETLLPFQRRSSRPTPKFCPTAELSCSPCIR